MSRPECNRNDLTPEAIVSALHKALKAEDPNGAIMSPRKAEKVIIDGSFDYWKLAELILAEFKSSNSLAETPKRT